MITLNFSVNDQLLTRTDENTVAANSHLVHTCEFVFSSEWDNRGKVATFKKRDLMLSVILDDDACTIPPEILQSENKIDVFELSVCGADGNSTITSTVVKVPILAGTWDVMSTEITPTMFEQIMQKIDEVEKGEISPELVLEAVTEYMEAHPLDPIVAEDVAAYFVEHAAELKGPKGDTGATGATGPKGDTGNGIASIEKTATSGLVDTYTITFTNGNTTTFTVSNGLGIKSADINANGHLIITYSDDTTYDAGALSDIYATAADVDAKLNGVWKSQGELNESFNKGYLSPNTVYPQSIVGVTGVMQYLAQVLHNKKWTVVSGHYVLVDFEGEDVYLFETGKGWVHCDSSVIIVDKSNVATKVSNINGAVNLATLAANQYGAINKSEFHYLDFDFVNDNKLPHETKNLMELPKTNFGTYNYAVGIARYIPEGQSGIRAFHPFLLNGSAILSGCNGATYYELDGTVGGRLSIVNNTISAENKIVVVFSDNIADASITFPSAAYEYTDELCSVLGDSLTADAPYYPYLAEITGMQIKNCGIGGTSIAGAHANSMWQDVRINALEGKFIVIMGGTNDNSNNIGTLSMDNYDTATFVGAYNVMLSKIYYRYQISSGYYQNIDYSGVEQLTAATFPNIILVTPPKGFADGATSENKLKTIGEAVKQIAQWWGLPVVDAFSNMQMSLVSIDYFFGAQDRTHYNAHGRSKLAALIAAKMNECYSNFDDQE